MAANAQKSKFFVRCSNNLALGQVPQPLVNHLLGHFVQRFSKGNPLEEYRRWYRGKTTLMWQLSELDPPV